MPEAVRLVIWDLDETFWRGTLTEGGFTYDQSTHDIVIELARRGIMSSICSKNNIEDVRPILEERGIWEYFIFPSIDWTPKGLRLKNIVEQVQLRPETILFIDDNPLNLQEARHYEPGLQVADETCIPGLLDNPLFKGKDDRGLTRLNQYKILETKNRDQIATAGDNTAFLRASDIRVRFEFDIEGNIDRAVELINRTNQLNFTKNRLPDDPEEARQELRALVSRHWVQAALIQVSDKYGDYGYCGIYVLSKTVQNEHLRHYCFSCRILNMGVEEWVYRSLGRPHVKIVGEVLTDLRTERGEIDWISPVLDGVSAERDGGAGRIGSAYLRGGCDLRALEHYFGLGAANLITEVSEPHQGVEIRLDHTHFLRYALGGPPADVLAAFQRAGHTAEHLRTRLGESLAEPRVFIFSFWADSHVRVYRDRASGALIPILFQGVGGIDLTKVSEEEFAARVSNPAAIETHRYLRAQTEFVGLIREAEFKANLQAIFAAIPAQSQIFIIETNPVGRAPKGEEGTRTIPRIANVNRWIGEVARGDNRVRIIRFADFIDSAAGDSVGNHFDRMTYYRLARSIIAQVGERAEAA